MSHLELLDFFFVNSLHILFPFSLIIPIYLSSLILKQIQDIASFICIYLSVHFFLKRTLKYTVIPKNTNFLSPTIWNVIFKKVGLNQDLNKESTHCNWWLCIYSPCNIFKVKFQAYRKVQVQICLYLPPQFYK